MEKMEETFQLRFNSDNNNSSWRAINNDNSNNYHNNNHNSYDDNSYDDNSYDDNSYDDNSNKQSRSRTRKVMIEERRKKRNLKA